MLFLQIIAITQITDGQAVCVILCYKFRLLSYISSNEVVRIQKVTATSLLYAKRRMSASLNLVGKFTQIT